MMAGLEQPARHRRAHDSSSNPRNFHLDSLQAARLRHVRQRRGLKSMSRTGDENKDYPAAADSFSVLCPATDSETRYAAACLSIAVPLKKSGLVPAQNRTALPN